jgi:hypothetical protein
MLSTSCRTSANRPRRCKDSQGSCGASVKCGDEMWGQTGRTPLFWRCTPSEEPVNVPSVPRFLHPCTAAERHFAVLHYHVQSLANHEVRGFEGLVSEKVGTIDHISKSDCQYESLYLHFSVGLYIDDDGGLHGDRDEKYRCVHACSPAQRETISVLVCPSYACAPLILSRVRTRTRAGTKQERPMRSDALLSCISSS